MPFKVTELLVHSRLEVSGWALELSDVSWDGSVLLQLHRCFSKSEKLGKGQLLSFTLLNKSALGLILH